MVLEPPIFVSTGTLVPEIDPEELLNPDQLLKLVRKLGLPEGPFRPAVSLAQRLGFPRRPLLLPLEALHQLGVIPHPHRFLADSAYLPLKELHDCWVDPLVQLGLASRQESLAAACIKFRKFLEHFDGRKAIVIGQSQGGLVMLELAMEPEFRDYIELVDVAGAPILGVPKLEAWPLKLATVLPGVAQMKCDSPSLAVLRERVATEWPLNVPVNLIGAPGDPLVPLESALTLKLPEGAALNRYYVGPHPLDSSEDVKHLVASSEFAHTRMCWRPSVVGLVAEQRRQLTAEAPDYPKLTLAA